ncbi:MAG: polyprenyl synthetase family protein [Oscillospiraceae bacterium]|nr:polyprenyl synthetase family protein [Oscillospiraceae bacterium]
MRERLAGWASGIERELAGFCEPEGPEYERFANMLRYGLLGGGKRLRGGLLLAAYGAMGGDDLDGEALRFAAALECVHAFSLIHDDLPSMDNAAERRGKPSHHMVYGEGMSVLSGDALLAIAAERMLDMTAKAVDPIRVRRRVGASLAVTRSAGTRGIALGQFMDLEGTRSPRWMGGGVGGRAALLADIDQRKTAEMFRAALEAGFTLAGAEDWEIAAAVSFGLKLGMLFQIRDDIQDVGADEGMVTWPAVHGLDESKRRADALERGALSDLGKLGGRGLPLAEFAEMMRGFS